MPAKKHVTPTVNCPKSLNPCVEELVLSKDICHYHAFRMKDSCHLLQKLTRGHMKGNILVAKGIEYNHIVCRTRLLGGLLANENTTIEFGKDILVEGEALPAGKYGIHMIPSEKDWIIIFSKNNSAWGSFQYNQEEDALRVTVTPVKAPHKEWMVFGFEDLAGTSATAYLHWEELKVPFKIKLAE